MRCRILKEGVSHRRHEYIIESDEHFSETKFVDALNRGLSGMFQYQLMKAKTGYVLVDDDLVKVPLDCSKVYAEFYFNPLSNKRQTMLCVKRRALQRENLREVIQTFLACSYSRNNLNLQESQLCPDRQPDLFQLG